VTKDWRKLHNVELHDFQSSQNEISITKSRTVCWVGHVERIGRKINKYKFLIAKPRGKRPL
jgi:hypothetical protein